jgi:hypothetical protein
MTTILHKATTILLRLARGNARYRPLLVTAQNQAANKKDGPSNRDGQNQSAGPLRQRPFWRLGRRPEALTWWLQEVTASEECQDRQTT